MAIEEALCFGWVDGVRRSLEWVVSAQKDETKRRRLARLIEDSAAGRRVPPLARPTDRS